MTHVTCRLQERSPDSLVLFNGLFLRGGKRRKRDVTGRGKREVKDKGKGGGRERRGAASPPKIF